MPPCIWATSGTEVYLQELNATLLENEEYLRGEVLAALDRIENGTYGTCENCGAKIVEERLGLLPYARYCTPCAEKLQAGKDINLNEGRPREAAGRFNEYDSRAEAEIKGTDYTSQDIPVDGSAVSGAGRRKHDDIHAAGTAGGGTAEGGLAGTNIAEGDPDNADLEDAMGTSTHDVAIEADDEETVPIQARRAARSAARRPASGPSAARSGRGGIVPSEDPDRAESG